MARVKLSEFRAKKLLAQALGFDYKGVGLDVEVAPQTVLKKIPEGKYAVKVDQATKKRNQSGLVKLNRSKAEIEADLKEFASKGFRYVLIEPMVKHEPKDEHFLALQRTEAGIEIQYSEKGGIDIEKQVDSLQKLIIKSSDDLSHSNILKNIRIGTRPENLIKIVNLFNSVNMAYLEINPLLVYPDRLMPLDAALEVDSTAELNVQGAWTSDDIRTSATKKTNSEKKVEELQATSMAALTLRVINPDGSILLLLSGGGASLVVADEFDAHGLAEELINYGEYSGNPNEDELYGYTTAAIQLIKDSKSKKKIIVIAGGVANFTDIATTFKGIIRAFDGEKEYLKKNNVSVFVRRGGPNQEKGLKLMEDFLSQIGLEHKVYGPDVSLADLVKQVADEVKK